LPVSRFAAGNLSEGSLVFAKTARRLFSPLLDRREIDQIAAEISVFHETKQHGLALAFGQRPDSAEKTFG
jgi:hypothetical protein